MECAAIRLVFGAPRRQDADQLNKIDAWPHPGRCRRHRGRATAFALDRGVLPPTANFTQPDPDCDLDVIPNQARAASVEIALSQSFAFGGLNAVLALRSMR